LRATLWTPDDFAEVAGLMAIVILGRTCFDVIRGEVVVGQLRGFRVHGSGLGVCIRSDSVEDRVKRGIVVHLELAVELEAAAVRADVCPKLGEADCEVVTLLVKDGETLAVALAMLGCGGGAVDFLGGVKDF